MKIFFSCSTHTQNTIFAVIGKNFRKDLLTLLLSTTKQYKDFKCITIQLQTTCLGSSPKSQDFLDSSLIFKLTTLLNLDIQNLLATANNFKTLASSDNLGILHYVNKMNHNSRMLNPIMKSMSKMLKTKNRKSWRRS